MSEIDDNRAALVHMDEALGAMRGALQIVRERTTDMADKVGQIWAGGNDLAGNVARPLLAAEDHMSSMDTLLLGAQAEAVHALVILDRVAGDSPRETGG